MQVQVQVQMVQRCRGAEVVQRYRGEEVQWCRCACALILGFVLVVQRCRENVAEVMQRLTTVGANIHLV
jgi:hypothetical protein